MTRFRHRDGSTVHVAYCTNMHPAEDLDGVIAQLNTYARSVREELGWATLGVGLWLPAPLATTLANDANVLKQCLDANGLEVVTLNGFPYKAFQEDVVKLGVYRPDWTETERLEYTVNLARILHQLLPLDASEGSISTLPLGWRTRDLSSAPGMLQSLAEQLEKLAVEHGRPVRLAIEPEPGCEVETAKHAIDVIASLNTEWIGMCLDTCHLAVQFENAEATVALARDREVQIVKAQISNALRVPDPNDTDWLKDFNEPRFLHQARQLQNGIVVGVDDLADNTRATLSGDSEWRVHYHVPLHHSDARTTQSTMTEAIHALVGGDTAHTSHLELETYTWSVLPAGRREDLVQGIANEFRWVAQQLHEAGLERIV